MFNEYAVFTINYYELIAHHDCLKKTNEIKQKITIHITT